MSVIVRTVARTVVGFIFLYGIYVVCYGHLSPGGGFGGGVVIACSFILLLLAYGKSYALKAFGYRAAKSFDSLGALLFLALALMGLVLSGGVFFLNTIQKNFPGQPLRLLNGGIVPLSNVAIAVKVSASLFLAAVVLAALRVKAGGADGDFESQED
jgi:multicomponent Na+:H+ antiporter subunit B